jgi:iron uptake system EfeUOB component EfeO/EfeM
MTEAAGRKHIALESLLVIAGALLCARPAMAQDVKSYTRATFDQWLSKYKDAKPDFKPGDVLTAKDLERIADRVTNIAEDVVFLHTGHIVELGGH